MLNWQLQSLAVINAKGYVELQQVSSLFPEDKVICMQGETNVAALFF